MTVVYKHKCISDGSSYFTTYYVNGFINVFRENDNQTADLLI